MVSGDVGLIVSAVVNQSKGVGADEVCVIIERVRHALTKELPTEGTSVPVFNVEPKTKKEIKDSIGENHLFSFEDGLGYKCLKRHLSSRGLTPETYREKHGLPLDYPMVHPNYSEARSVLAKKMKLGQIKITTD